MLNTSSDEPQADGGNSTYQPSETSVSPPGLTAQKKRSSLSTPTLVAAWLSALLLTLVLASVGMETLSGLLFGCTLLLILFTSVVSLARVFKGALKIIGGAHTDLGSTVADVVGNGAMFLFGAWIAFLATFGFSRGRQLRRSGIVQLPGLRSHGSWASELKTEFSVDAPQGVADQWRENGKTEHASVAAFARLTLDLMALGAPPALIAGSNQDALDEIRHTELCFSLAHALDGRSISPAAFPEAQRVASLPRNRTLALSKLGVDSLVDGALHEGVSARIIAKLSKRCEVPAIRAILTEIAADEGRHAAHGWAVVRWCVDEGGAPVVNALAGAVAALPRRMNSELPEAARDGSWERWGIHGNELEMLEYDSAVTHLRSRVHALVDDRLRRAA